MVRMGSFVIVLFLLLSFSLFSEEPENCQTNEVMPDFGVRVSSINKDCSAEVLQKESLSTDAPLASYFDVPKEKMCTCLEGAKFNEIRVPKHRVKSFKQWEYDQALREKLKASFNDMVANFSKFNTLILTKDHLGNLIDEKEINGAAGGFCNIETIVSRIEELQKKEGTDECPSPKGFMHHRLNEIFGTTNMKDLPQKLKQNLAEVDKNSCVPQSLFLNLRSSNGASARGFEFLTKGIPDHRQFQAHFNNPDLKDKGPFKDLLSYDVLFNLAYRDETFYEEYKNRLNEHEAKGGRRYDIYNDGKTLSKAYTSLNKSCNDLSKSINKFLCANEYPKMKPATLNMHLDDYFKDDKSEDDITKRSMRDFFTWDYSCNDQRNANTYKRSVVGVLKGAEKERVELSKDEEEFNDFIEKSVLVKKTTKDTLNTNAESDYATFNELFCGDRKGKPIKVDDLPAMTKEYLAKLAKNGKDINSILSDPELSKKLGLKIDASKDPIEFSLTNEESIKKGKLPYISQSKWDEVMAPALKAKGMSDDEIYQLYSIVEMQTNRKYTEMEDLKYKLAKENPDYQNLTLSEIDKIVRLKDPKINEEIRNRLISTGKIDPNSTFLQTDFVSGVQNRHEAQKNDQTMDLNYSQDVFFGDRKIEDIKNEAVAYNSNSSTYDNNYSPNGSRSKDTGTQWGTSNSKASGTFNDSKSIASNNSNLNDSDIPNSNNSSGPGTSSGSQGNSTSTSPKFEANKDFNSNFSNTGMSSTEGDNPRPYQKRSGNSDSPKSDDDSSGASIADKETFRPVSIKDEIAKINEKAKQGRGFNPSSSSNKNPDSGGTSDYETSSSSNGSGPFSPGSNSGSNAAYSPKAAGVNETSSNPKDPTSTNSKGQTSVSGDGGGRTPASADGGNAPAGSFGGTDLAKVAKALEGINPNIAGDVDPEDENLTPEQYRKKYGIPIYEFHKIIPGAILEVTGSVENLVVILGLEGQSWKLLEYEEKGGETKYYLTDYDFVPEGEFESDKEKFKTKEGREDFYNSYFTYPKNKDNLNVSKRLAKFTKKQKKYEVTSTFIKKNQSKIMNDEELKNIVYKLAEKLK